MAVVWQSKNEAGMQRGPEGIKAKNGEQGGKAVESRSKNNEPKKRKAAKVDLLFPVTPLTMIKNNERENVNKRKLRNMRGRQKLGKQTKCEMHRVNATNKGGPTHLMAARPAPSQSSDQLTRRTGFQESRLRGSFASSCGLQTDGVSLSATRCLASCAGCGRLKRPRIDQSFALAGRAGARATNGDSWPQRFGA